MITERDAAIMQGLDKVLHALSELGDAVADVIKAINVPNVEIPDTGGYEDLRHQFCGSCGKPAYPHPYRHPITTSFSSIRPRPVRDNPQA